MTAELLAALTGALTDLDTDLEFQARALAGLGRQYGRALLFGAADAALLGAGWPALSPLTWKAVRVDNTRVSVLRRVRHSVHGDLTVFLEFTAPLSLTVSLYDSHNPSEQILLASWVLPVDPVTWQALEAR